jgi:signal transduction histidine kinase/CheY-like chemotaxis protein
MKSGKDAGRRTLRRKAEERLRARPAGPRVEATQDVLRLIHELQVHQIELELQNEELRRARDELEASATRYSELYDFAPVGYVTLDAKSTILEINLVGSTLLGKDRARLVGERFASWVTPATRPALEGLLSTLQREERASCDLAITGAKGPVYLHVDAVPEAPARAAEWRCRAALTDVTEVRAAAELRESDRRKSAFLAVLSHELRNPLGPIANAIRLLERVPPGSEQAMRARAVIERQTAQLTRLVDDLLDLTRIERGKVELKPEVVDLREIVRRTCDDYRDTFEQRGVELHVTAPARAVTVRGDSARLTQVMGNMLSNAVKYTLSGGTVTVVVGQAAGRAEFRVRDTGIGVASEQLDHVFEPFAQVDQGLARTAGGLGLGLSLVKGLVEMHGGTVAGASAGPGRGAEFVVTLPLAAPAANSPRAEVRKPPSRSIVIIEDNADGAATLAELLALDGHQVEVANDGRSGMELVRRVRPHIVFCDIGLPDLSGYEVARALRGDEALRATRLVALSGYAQPEDRERSREAGFDAHLAKPIGIDEVNAVLAGTDSA